MLLPFVSGASDNRCQLANWCPYSGRLHCPIRRLALDADLTIHHILSSLPVSSANLTKALAHTVLQYALAVPAGDALRKRNYPRLCGRSR
jgi:hypothetical protein